MSVQRRSFWPRGQTRCSYLVSKQRLPPSLCSAAADEERQITINREVEYGQLTGGEGGGRGMREEGKMEERNAPGGRMEGEIGLSPQCPSHCSV